MRDRVAGEEVERAQNKIESWAKRSPSISSRSESTSEIEMGCRLYRKP